MKTWALKRQLIGISVILFLILVVSLLITYYIYPKSSCSDGVKNGDEEGTDCGGSCDQICLEKTQALRLLWQRFFKVREGVYDAGAMIENPNFNTGSRRVDYTVKLYDDASVLLDSRSGTTYVYPGERMFIYEPLLVAGPRNPARVDFRIDSVQWEHMDALPELEINVTRKEFSEKPSPQVRVVLANKSFFSERNIDLIILLEQRDGNVYAASRSFIEELPEGESREVFFTWPTSSFETPTNINLLYRPRIQ